MGWRGIIRDMQAASRRADRKAYRDRRALEKHQVQYERMLEADQASYEVEVYENQIEELLSVHKECGYVCDWHAIETAPPPSVSNRTDDHEKKARLDLSKYSPSVLDRLFRKTESKQVALIQGIEDAKKLDEDDYRRELESYQARNADWINSKQFASRILSGDLIAYMEATKETISLLDMEILGSSIQFTIPNSETIKAEINVYSEKLIPSVVKSKLRDHTAKDRVLECCIPTR